MNNRKEVREILTLIDDAFNKLAEARERTQFLLKEIESPSLTLGLTAEEGAIAMTGDRIRAITKLRSRTGVGLKEAVFLIDNYRESMK